MLDAVLDVDAVIDQPLALQRVVGHQPHAVDAQFLEHRSRHLVGSSVGRQPKSKVCVQGVVTQVLEVVGLNLGIQADASSFLTEVYDRADSGVLHGSHGQLQLRATVALEAPKRVTGEAFGVNAHQRCVCGRKVAYGQKRMFGPSLRIDEGMQGERAKRGWQLCLRWDVYVGGLNRDGHD